MRIYKSQTIIERGCTRVIWIYETNNNNVRLTHNQINRDSIAHRLVAIASQVNFRILLL